MTFPLGYGSVARLGRKQTNYTLPSQGGRTRRFNFGNLLPGVMKGIECLGNENSTGNCLLNAGVSTVLSNMFRGLPPGATRQLNSVAWVSCKRMCLGTVKLSARGINETSLPSYPSDIWQTNIILLLQHL